MSIGILIFCGCENRRYLDLAGYNKIISLCPSPDIKNEDMIVYYFDGDCGLCLAKVIFLEKRYSNDTNVKLIFIAKTLNPDVLKYNLSDKKIKSCVYLENKNEFEKILSFEKTIKLYTDRSYYDLDIE
jgi:hypothetical protein